MNFTVEQMVGLVFAFLVLCASTFGSLAGGDFEIFIGSSVAFFGGCVAIVTFFVEQLVGLVYVFLVAPRLAPFLSYVVVVFLGAYGVLYLEGEWLRVFSVAEWLSVFYLWHDWELPSCPRRAWTR